MSARSHLVFWTASILAFLVFVYLFSAALLPFVLGLAVAYLLNPLVGALGKIGLKRGPAALLILTVFFGVLLALLGALVPVLIHELDDFSQALPGYLDRLAALVSPLTQRLQVWIGQESGGDLTALIGRHAGEGANVAGRLLRGMAAGGQAVLDIISVTVFMPVVAYFMMKEWNAMTSWVIDLMPRDHKDTILGLLGQINTKLGGFVRGQLSVAFILGLLYATALTIAGLKFGLLVGFAAGLLSVIPMVGSTVGLLTGVLIAWVQTSQWTYVAVIAAIFLVGQVVEGYVLTPRLVGKSVGLHPLWIFFALLAGGSIFGILGMLLAVPVAVVVSVLAAFGLKRYKSSTFYEGRKDESKTKRRAL